jgi:predicted nucleic acid-binding protein
VCDLEVASALRRALLRNELTVGRAAEALADYLALPLRRHHHGRLLARILALRANLSAYDASYVALAERLEAPLLTGDRRLERAARRHTDIEVLGLYR